MKAKRDDVFWMQRALALARRGEGKTRPNPPVGAVLVRAGRIVGEGWHRRAGGPHAEVFALRAAGSKARGSTLYVTLEPCSTVGRTPACTDAILQSGLRRVVVGARDPNPRHSGRGLRILRAHGIPVASGVCKDESESLIRPFAKWIATGLPFVTIKLGVSLDGRIADRRGRSQWITGPAARARVQRMRHSADAVMAGSGTVLTDNPSLQCRYCGTSHLTRVLVDSRGRIPASARVLCDASASRTILAAVREIPASDARLRHGARAWRLPSAGGHVSLRSLLRRLGREGCLHVLCEGGGQLAAALMRQGLADQLVLFVAPVVLGGHSSVPAVGGAGWSLPVAPRFRFEECVKVGDDLMVRAVPAGKHKGAQSPCSLA